MHHPTCMPHRIQLLLTALTATIILATTVSTATAGRFSISNNAVRAAWANLEFSNSFTEGVIRCPVTLEGSFHGRTINKIRGILVGYISRAAVSNDTCTGGHATITQASLPWHLTYQAFTGTLPSITGVVVNLIRGGFTTESPGATCTATSSIANPARGTVLVGAGGAVTGLRADETASIPLTGGLCPLISGFFRGVASVTLLGTNNSISITLI